MVCYIQYVVLCQEHEFYVTYEVILETKNLFLRYHVSLHHFLDSNIIRNLKIIFSPYFNIHSLGTHYILNHSLIRNVLIKLRYQELR